MANPFQIFPGLITETGTTTTAGPSKQSPSGMGISFESIIAQLASGTPASAMDFSGVNHPEDAVIHQAPGGEQSGWVESIGTWGGTLHDSLRKLPESILMSAGSGNSAEAQQGELVEAQDIKLSELDHLSQALSENPNAPSTVLARLNLDSSTTDESPHFESLDVQLNADAESIDGSHAALLAGIAGQYGDLDVDSSWELQQRPGVLDASSSATINPADLHASDVNGQAILAAASQLSTQVSAATEDASNANDPNADGSRQSEVSGTQEFLAGLGNSKFAVDAPNARTVTDPLPDAEPMTADTLGEPLAKQPQGPPASAGDHTIVAAANPESPATKLSASAPTAPAGSHSNSDAANTSDTTPAPTGVYDNLPPQEAAAAVPQSNQPTEADLANEEQARNLSSTVTRSDAPRGSSEDRMKGRDSEVNVSGEDINGIVGQDGTWIPVVGNQNQAGQGSTGDSMFEELQLRVAKRNEASESASAAWMETMEANQQVEEQLESLSLDDLLVDSPADDAIRNVGETIKDAAEASLQQDGGEVELRLHPAELGGIKIRVVRAEHGLETRIVASEQMTGDLLNQHRDQLIDALADLGFDSSDVDISYQDQASQDSGSRPESEDSIYQFKPKIPTTNDRESDSSGGLNIVA